MAPSLTAPIEWPGTISTSRAVLGSCAGAPAAAASAAAMLSAAIGSLIEPPPAGDRGAVVDGLC